MPSFLLLLLLLFQTIVSSQTVYKGNTNSLYYLFEVINN